MKNIRKIAVGMGVAALLVVGWVAPQTSAEAVAPMGYTVVNSGGSCELATLDLVTGVLTDLPAGPSVEACALDLAASPSGAVYGIGFDSLSMGSIPQAITAGTFVTYAADGTATTMPITVADGSNGNMIFGGIAVSPSGTVYVHLVVDQVGCDTGAPDTSTTAPAGPAYLGDSVCLYTLDPGTGVATLVGTTDVYQTPFFGIAWCGGLNTLAFNGATGTWGTESASTGAVTLGPDAQSFPIGYDCDSTAGAPLWSLESPNSGPLASVQSTEVTISQVNPATGAVTTIVPVVDAAADLMALAVVPTAAPTPTTIEVANATEVAPAFTG
jgi:hypothetical protein